MKSVFFKWWIIEDALNSKQGHYYEYNRTFKEGLEAEGDSVRIFVDRTAEDWLVDSIGVERELPRSIWARMSDDAPRWKKLLRYPGHGWATYRAVRRLLRQNKDQLPDIIFVPSVFTHHLVGWVPLLRQQARAEGPKFLLFFPSTPIRFDPNTNATALKTDRTAQWFPRLVHHLAPLVENGQVILGVETRVMQCELVDLCGVPFSYFPHPVSLPIVDQSAVQSKDILIGCYGAARAEKGSDLFQAAARQFLQKYPATRVRFAMQWLDDFKDENDLWVRKDPFLMAHPKFEYISRLFNTDGEYLRQVQKTDLMVLPYRDSYRYRLSRVVIESILAGVPVVVSRDTTLCEQASEFGAAIRVEMNSVNSLLNGIEESVVKIRELKMQASKAKSIAAVHFSVATFRSFLR